MHESVVSAVWKCYTSVYKELDLIYNIHETAVYYKHTLHYGTSDGLESGVSCNLINSVITSVD